MIPIQIKPGDKIGIVSPFTSDYNFPILKVNDFGHNCPNTVLPVGAKVGLDADTQEIEILEQCVKAI